METKLTIKLPEELRRRAKAQAAREGTTLSQVIRERLEEFGKRAEVSGQVSEEPCAKHVPTLTPGPLAQWLGEGAAE